MQFPNGIKDSILFCTKIKLNFQICHVKKRFTKKTKKMWFFREWRVPEGPQEQHRGSPGSEKSLFLNLQNELYIAQNTFGIFTGGSKYNAQICQLQNDFFAKKHIFSTLKHC